MCWSYFTHEHPQKLVLAFLKRFPRLAALVTATTLASYALFKLELYYFRDAAEISGSPWLATFAYACSDEWHQTFVEGRSGQVSDVAFDMLGATQQQVSRMRGETMAMVRIAGRCCGICSSSQAAYSGL